MGISEKQLETWSNQGAIITSQKTHESIRNALNNSELLKERNYDVYLQGSYRNSTNIYGESDVDVVVQLNSVYNYNISGLTQSAQSKFHEEHDCVTYGYESFRSDILNVLIEYYGASEIADGNKSIKIARGSNRLAADVVVCTQYRYYTKYNGINDENYIEGMAFYPQNGCQKIVNYPKYHFNNGAKKNNPQNTNAWFKPVVRMFKNARIKLVNDEKISKGLAPSYFLECLLYNVPNSKFGKNYSDSYQNIINWLSDCNLDDFLCQHGLYKLFGFSTEQWSKENAETLIKNYVDLWKDW
ncbi:nucleotidyltransferase domain-containing protein [Methanosphaerula palustris]|nr:nucleotidyltransferase [Methanosphaerula palustris]